MSSSSFPTEGASSLIVVAASHKRKRSNSSVSESDDDLLSDGGREEEEEHTGDAAKREDHNLVRGDCTGNLYAAAVSSAASEKSSTSDNEVVEEEGESFQWAKLFLNDLVDNIDRATPLLVFNLMKEQHGKEPMPDFETVSHWLDRKRNNTLFEDTDDSSGKNDEQPAIMNISQAEKRENRKLAKELFNVLLESGYISSTSKVIFNVMQENLGKDLMPALSTIDGWLVMKRKEVSFKTQRWRWAKSYFDELIGEGYLRSTGKDIHGLILKKCQDDAEMPSIRLVHSWLGEKRKEVGYVSSAHVGVPQAGRGVQFVRPAWKVAKNHFLELMKNGHLSSTPRQVHILLKKLCVKDPTPSQDVVHNWLCRQRKAAGYVHADKWQWARAFFDDLMETGLMSSTGREIHKLMVKHGKGQRIPSQRSIHGWLAAKRNAFS